MKRKPADGEFEKFFAVVEPRLRVALTAGLGADRGGEANAEAFAWAYEHWDRVPAIKYPVAYLYRVGVSRTRRRLRRTLVERPTFHDIEVEPMLAAALDSLTARQRIAVVLTAAYGWHLEEVADLMQVTPSTVSAHAQRGMARLRAHLGVIHG